MPASISIEQKVTATVAYTTAAGNPAVVDGVPIWESSDGNIFTLNVAADGMSAECISAGFGMGTVTVTADADLGEGVFPIVLSDSVEVTPAGAASGVLGFGAPVIK